MDSAPREDFMSSLLTSQSAQRNVEILEDGDRHQSYIYDEEDDDDIISTYDSHQVRFDCAAAPTPSLMHKDYVRLKSNRMDELRQFRTSLRWWGLDQSTRINMVFSWFAFVLFVVLVPVFSFFSVVCPSCDVQQGYAFNKLVQIPESTLAAIAFLCLSRYVRRYGLRRFLFLDQLCDDTPQVQHGYARELEKAFKLLAWILLPSFLLEVAHKIVWFSSIATATIPFVHSRGLSNSLMFVAVLLSWLYRTGVFLLVCVLFHLTCHLQILRFEGFRKFLEEYSSDVSIILKEHMRIRHHLLVTSHRFRIFILASLLTITISQFAALIMILSSPSQKNFFYAGDLVVCSGVQLTGFLLCLSAAAKITHRAQGTVSVATRWHALSTCTSYGASYAQTETSPSHFQREEITTVNPFSNTVDSASDSESSEAFFMFPSKDASAAFQIRQAFVTYLQHNSGGITLFGFVLDRSLLYALFAFEFSLGSAHDGHAAAAFNVILLQLILKR